MDRPRRKAPLPAGCSRERTPGAAAELTDVCRSSRVGPAYRRPHFV